MGGLRKLRRTGKVTRVVEPLHADYGSRDKKLSAVLLDFARPLTESLDDRDFRAAVCIAVFCWNIALFPEDKQERERRFIVQELIKDAPEIADYVEVWSRILLDRKKALFAHDRRMVVEHKVIEEGDYRHLSVVSTPLSDSIRLPSKTERSTL